VENTTSIATEIKRILNKKANNFCALDNQKGSRPLLPFFIVRKNYFAPKLEFKKVIANIKNRLTVPLCHLPNMKIAKTPFIYVKLLLLLSVLLMGNMHSNGQKKVVDFHFINFSNDNGTARVGVYNNPKNFCNESIKPYKEVSGKISNKECTLSIFDLPDGEYAFTLLHDENEDAVMNYNFLGLPKEGYAFSNNAFPILSKPSFNTCKIKISNGIIVSQTIHVRYLLK
jgi:uncharacterized protein (DUF2141 family)